MKRLATIAGCCLMSLGSLPGCAAYTSRRDRTAERTPQVVSREALNQAATLAMDRGDYTQARIDLERLLSQSPRSAELHFRLGKVLQCLTHFDEAEAEYREALRIDPLYVGALVGLGHVEAWLGRPKEALQRFEKAIEVDPHQAEAHFARGQVLESLGRPNDALVAYFRSLQIDKDSAPTILRVATLQLERGEPEQALVRLDRAKELAPENHEIRFRRGQTLLTLKRPKLAVADLSFAADKAPDRADILLTLAQAFEADQQTLMARQTLDKALRIQPDSPVARELSERLRR